MRWPKLHKAAAFLMPTDRSTKCLTSLPLPMLIQPTPVHASKFYLTAHVLFDLFFFFFLEHAMLDQSHIQRRTHSSFHNLKSQLQFVNFKDIFSGLRLKDFDIFKLTDPFRFQAIVREPPMNMQGHQRFVSNMSSGCSIQIVGMLSSH